MLAVLLLAGPTALAERITLVVDASHSGPAATEAVDGAVFTSIQDAVDAAAALREADAWPEDGIVVGVRTSNEHPLDPVTLELRHSGSEGAPLIIRASRAPEEQPMTPWGTTLGTPGSAAPFGPVTDAAILDRLPDAARAHVLQADLDALGINRDDLGELTARGFGQPVYESHAELIVDGEVMTLAQWPNEGWTTIKDAPDGPDAGYFTFDDAERLARWSTADDAWVHGYWTWDWADSYAKIDRIDTETGAIHTAEPHGVYGYKPGQRFRILNLLEELDEPGEWYLDRGTGTLYFWPPDSIENLAVSLSTATNAFVIEGARHIVIEGFRFAGLRGTAVAIRDSEDITVRDCVFSAIGNRAVTVSGGKRVTVADCTISNTGDGGITLGGGDRATLEPANHAAIGNTITKYSRWSRTYRPGVQVDGVGVRVANNHIHDAPHNGIQLSGNDHLIELNRLHDLCQDTGDVGAFYMGRDWTMRGTIIRHNYFHDIKGPYTHGAMGVYLDDAASGITIVGNIFKNVTRAAFIGGGRDNIVENNLFIDCEPSVHIDARGLTWAKEHISEGGPWGIHERYHAMNPTEPPYSERYPELVTLLDEKPDHPFGNAVRHNISIGGKWLDLHSVEREWVDFGENWTDASEDILIDWYGIPDVPADQRPEWFEPIPVEKIGVEH